MFPTCVIVAAVPVPNISSNFPVAFASRTCQDLSIAKIILDLIEVAFGTMDLSYILCP